MGASPPQRSLNFTGVAINGGRSNPSSANKSKILNFLLQQSGILKPVVQTQSY